MRPLNVNLKAQIKELNSRNVLMPEEFTKDLKKSIYLSLFLLH